MITEGLPPNTVSLLLSVFAMAALTFVMMLWMVATRVPAMQRAGLDPQAAAHTSALRGKLPASAERVADNYNHLSEAPTVFYAVVIGIVLLGLADQVHVVSAWVYVSLRVAHSLVQATINRVSLRFLLFLLSWAALVLMIGRVIAAAVRP